MRQKIAREKPRHTTRQSSGAVWEVILPLMPELIGGSVDLIPSNTTYVKSFGPVTSSNYAGRYMHYGVGEHVMAAMLTGMALHAAFIPCGGTFMQFADDCRWSIRLAALMGQRVLFITTHDSIGRGEDGPTHQPIEHRTALRAIPNVLARKVYRHDRLWRFSTS
jgi:transketolase